MLWKHLAHTVAAVKIGWLGFAMTLVSIYVPPLTYSHRSYLGDTGLLPTKTAYLTDLGAMLKVFYPNKSWCSSSVTLMPAQLHFPPP